LSLTFRNGTWRNRPWLALALILNIYKSYFIVSLAKVKWNILWYLIIDSSWNLSRVYTDLSLILFHFQILRKRMDIRIIKYYISANKINILFYWTFVNTIRVETRWNKWCWCWSWIIGIITRFLRKNNCQNNTNQN
jgi:hypothetical protein